MRELGLYWVKYSGEWTVAEWTTHGWFMIGNECEEPDNKMEEIDETLLVRHELDNADQ